MASCGGEGPTPFSALRDRIQVQHNQEDSLRRITPLQHDMEIATCVGGGRKFRHVTGLDDQIMGKLFPSATGHPRDSNRAVRLLGKRIKQLRRKRKIRLRCDGGRHVKPAASLA